MNANAYSEDLPWNPSGHTAKRGELLVSGKVIGLVEVAVLERSLALGVKVGGRGSGVHLGVLARRVARGINKSGVQADSLL